MDNRVQKILDKDIVATLESFPELQLISHKKRRALKGTYTVKDNFGVVQGEYEILIVIPEKYPSEFPALIELSHKVIPRIDDRHINASGLACVEIEQNILLKSKKGITIKEFVEIYVHRYFCWQLRYDAGDFEGLEEWAHYEKGTIQFYNEKLQINDLGIIIKVIKLLLENNLPKRNDPCVCSSGKKFKNCHLILIEAIDNLGSTQFIKDLNALEKMNVV